MKTLNIAKRIFVLLAASGLALVASCIRDLDHNEAQDTVGDDATVTFSVNVPGNAAPATRGLGINDETNVETVDILLFNKNENGDRVYYGRVPGVSIDNTPGTTKTFKAVISVKDHNNFDISVVANANDVIINASLTKGDPKNSILNSLVKTVMAGHKWNSNRIPMWGESINVTVNTSTNLSGAKAIKMIRMVSRIDVLLTDMAAHGDDSPAIPNFKNFKLNSVRLYNYSTHGTVVPDLAAGWNPGSNKATTVNQPSIGYGTVLYDNSANQPLVYTSADQPSDGIMPAALLRSIYTFEAPAGSHSNLPGNTCLVVGGYYNNSVKETYYRIDFARKNTSNDTYEYLSLLRNHLYEVKVTKISGAGFENPDEAFKSLPINIETEITDWNEGEMGDTVFDGQYLLSIRPGSQIEFSKDSELKTLEIRTDYPTGWKVVKITELAGGGVTENDITSGGGWLGVPNNAVGTYYGSNGQYTALDIKVNANNSGSERKGYVYIQAGRLTARIEVIQNNTVNSTLTITDADNNEIDALIFYSAVGVDPLPNIFKVKWTPQSEALYTSVNSVGKPGSSSPYDSLLFVSYRVESGHFYETGNTVSVSNIDSGAGIAEFTVSPSAIPMPPIESDPFYERRTSVTFSINTPTGQLYKTIMLQHVVNYAVIEKEPFYLANGDWYSFTVKSNSPWRVFFVDNGDGMIEQPGVSTVTEMDSGAYNMPLGRQVIFKTFDDLSNPVKYTGTGIVKLQYQAVDGLWHDVLETDGTANLKLFCASGMIQPLANCYIINNDIPILIPVKRANGYRSVGGNIAQDPLWSSKGYPDQIGSNTQYTAELVWSDMKGTGGKGLASDGSTPVRLLHTAGTGDTGYILVQGGDVKGNALVAAKVNGTIVWTWHIWVVDYWPYDALGNAYGNGTNNAWMDRNLGATSNGYKPGTSDLEASATELFKTTGLYYQWGRMTPMPGGKNWSTNTTDAKDVYTAGGDVYAIKNHNSHVNENMKTAISNPNRFYNHNYHWYGDSAYATLWGDAGTKTIYDPCPAGWRVPKLSGAPSFSGISFSSSHAYGMASPNYGGFYPYAGFLSAEYKIGDVGSSGSYWTSTYGTNYHYIYIRNGGLIYSNYSGSAFGRSVRCVKE